MSLLSKFQPLSHQPQPHPELSLIYNYQDVRPYRNIPCWLRPDPRHDHRMVNCVLGGCHLFRAYNHGGGFHDHLTGVLFVLCLDVLQSPLDGSEVVEFDHLHDFCDGYKKRASGNGP
jgi:hypothetical protein